MLSRTKYNFIVIHIHTAIATQHTIPYTRRYPNPHTDYTHRILPSASHALFAAHLAGTRSASLG
ncbi:hypothetical protein EON63_23555, partial [archaeon]